MDRREYANRSTGVLRAFRRVMKRVGPRLFAKQIVAIKLELVRREIEADDIVNTGVVEGWQ